jgi:hypothetical protein
MGYVTTVLFYNDSIQEMIKDPTFLKRLYDVIISTSITNDEVDVPYINFKPTFIDKFLAHFGLYRAKQSLNNSGWSSGSCAIVLPSHHSDDTRTLVVAGNTICDLTQYYYNILNHRQPTNISMDYIKSCLQIAEYDTKNLKKIINSKG